jgi:hypothetical protein
VAVGCGVGAVVGCGVGASTGSGVGVGFTVVGGVGVFAGVITGTPVGDGICPADVGGVGLTAPRVGMMPGPPPVTGRGVGAGTGVDGTFSLVGISPDGAGDALCVPVLCW